MSARQIRRMREYYFATVTLIDRQVEKIIRALKSKGLLESTLIVFSSDHGDHLGDHGLPFKLTFYESSLMVPLIVRGPGVAKGARCSSFVNWLDLHATFLSLAGIEIPDHAQGRDITALFADPTQEVRQEIASELIGRVMMRNRRHKLVLCDDGSGELYDLREQPLEVHNHFDDPVFRDVREELTDKIIRHLLAHSRVRSFGGGRNAPDAEREERFRVIRKKLSRGEYPGL